MRCVMAIAGALASFFLAGAVPAAPGDVVDGDAVYVSPKPAWVDVQPTQATVYVLAGSYTAASGPPSVDFGVTGAYGQTVSAGSATDDQIERIFVASLPGLSPNTEYHWRLHFKTGPFDLSTGDQVLRTSPDGAPRATSPPTVALVGTGPVLGCLPAGWDDADAQLSLAWGLLSSFAPIKALPAGPQLTYEWAGTYRCTVTARNASGTSSATALDEVDQSRIPLRFLSLTGGSPEVLVAPATPTSSPTDASCQNWSTYGRTGPEQDTIRWWFDGVLVAESRNRTLPLHAGDAGRSVVCEVTASRGGDTITARSAPVSIPGPRGGVVIGGGHASDSGSSGVATGHVGAAALRFRTIAVRGRRASVQLVCPGTANCAGTIALVARRLVIGSARYRIPVGQSQTVRIELTPPARRRLKRAHGRLVARARITATGTTSRMTTTVVLKARRTSAGRP